MSSKHLSAYLPGGQLNLSSLSKVGTILVITLWEAKNSGANTRDSPLPRRWTCVPVSCGLIESEGALKQDLECGIVHACDELMTLNLSGDIAEPPAHGPVGRVVVDMLMGATEEVSDAS